MKQEEIVVSWNREQYLDRCRASSSISATDLALWGIVIVVLLAGCDLLLTLMKISAGNFVDDNPIAQVFIKHGMHAGLITFKVSAVTFFAFVGAKGRHLLTTQIGVGVALLVHLLLLFHWVLVF